MDNLKWGTLDDSIFFSILERFDQSHFKSSIKKPKDEVKYSIEDARKRRQENAKERTRRASVMGLLEAEKLKQRKLSIASINPIAGWSNFLIFYPSFSTPA